MTVPIPGQPFRPRSARLGARLADAQTPRRDHCVPHFWARAVLDKCGLAQTQRRAACEEAGLDPAILDAPFAEISVRTEIRLIEALARQSERRFFGAEMGLAHDPRHGSILAYLVFNSPTLGDALKSLCHFVSITRPNARLALIRDGDRVSFRISNADPTLRFSTEYVEFVVAATLKSWRVATGLPRLGLDVALASPRRSGASELSRLFGCRVRLGADETEIGLPAATLRQRHVTADPALLWHLTDYGERLLDQCRTRPPSLVEQTQAQILRQLPHGGPSLWRTAEALAVSQRSLARRLAEKGESFRTISEGLRRALAEKYLADPGLTICEIAFLLGYVDQSSFGAAFRRWTGDSPRRFRAGLERNDPRACEGRDR